MFLRVKIRHIIHVLVLQIFCMFNFNCGVKYYILIGSFFVNKNVIVIWCYMDF